MQGLAERYNYLPINSDYGTGLFRRGVRLTGRPGEVFAEVEDPYHGMRCTLRHDGERITDIVGEVVRAPFTTCPEASAPIKKLIGLELALSARDSPRRGDPRGNCTHLFDLALLAIAHASRRSEVREYAIEISDENTEPACAKVWLNGQLQHEWRIRSGQLVDPPEIAGRPVLEGFLVFATTLFEGDKLEAARVLQKGYFVAQVRRYDVFSLKGQGAESETAMLGSCWSFSDAVVPRAIRVGDNERDFNSNPEAVLRFI